MALVFSWQYADLRAGLSLWPTAGTLAKIAGFMLLAWLLVREFGPRVGRALDRRYAVDGSTLLVSDAFYLWLQIPIILMYAAFLHAQLASAAA